LRLTVAGGLMVRAAEFEEEKAVVPAVPLIDTR
jgi:hypothetical protein